MTPEERKIVKSFAEISDLRGAWDLFIHWAIVVACWFAAYQTQNAVVVVLAFLIIAVCQNGFASLSHEASHYKCFSRRKWNQWIGAWFYAYPIGMPFEHNRKNHLTHHRKVGTPSDPDWPSYEDEAFHHKRTLVTFLLKRGSGWYLIESLYYGLFKGKHPIHNNQEASSSSDTRNGFIQVAICQIILFGLVSYAFHWSIYLFLWIAPMVTIASMLVGFRTFIEHSNHDTDCPADERLRDFDVNTLEHWAISPCHFHLHALHHAYPAVPHYRYPALAKALKAAGIKHRGSQEGSYFAYTSNFFKQARSD